MAVTLPPGAKAPLPRTEEVARADAPKTPVPADAPSKATPTSSPPPSDVVDHSQTASVTVPVSHSATDGLEKTSGSGAQSTHSETPVSAPSLSHNEVSKLDDAAVVLGKVSGAADSDGDGAPVVVVANPIQAAIADGKVGPFLDGDHLHWQIEGLHEEFSDYMTYKMIQADYLEGRDGPERQGVCRAIVVKWLSRILFKDKPSFSVSKKSDKPLDVEDGTGWNNRMAKKYLKDFIPSQVNKTKLEHFADANLNRELVKALPLVEGIGQVVFPKLAEEILPDMFEKIEPDKTYAIEILHPGKGTGGHGVALSTEGANDDGSPRTVRFMDPNVGEFTFTIPDNMEVLGEFLDNWLNLYNPGEPSYSRMGIYEVAPGGG